MIESTGIKYRYFKMPDPNSEYSLTKRTYFAQIIDNLLKKTPIENDREYSSELESKETDNNSEPSFEQFSEAVKGLTSAFSNLMPFTSRELAIQNDDGLDLKSQNILEKEKSVEQKSMKIDWNDSNDESYENEDAIKVDSDYDNVIDTDEDNDEDNYEDNDEDNYEDDTELDLDPEELSDGLEAMMNIFGNKLGSLFSGMQGTLNSIAEQLNDLENDIEEEYSESSDDEIEEVSDEIHDLNNSLEDVKENLERGIVNPFEILQNFGSILANIQENIGKIDEKSDEENKTEIQIHGILAEDWRNDQKMHLGPKDNADFVLDLIETLEEIAKNDPNFVLILDNLENAKPMTIQILEQLIAQKHQYHIPIIGLNNSKFNIEGQDQKKRNKDLRLFLVKLKLDSLGYLIEF